MTIQGNKDTISIKIDPRIVAAIKSMIASKDPDFNRSAYVEDLIIKDLRERRKKDERKTGG
jgi:metal-responsive CopG/Arc/MetJ family transcriptional regulator